jgi:hypothetical protein
MSQTKDGVEDAPSKTAGGSESDGGAYPNPHTGKTPKGGGFMGHGGQTEIAYSGTGQGGLDDDPEVGNANAVTKGE